MLVVEIVSVIYEDEVEGLLDEVFTVVAITSELHIAIQVACVRFARQVFEECLWVWPTPNCCQFQTHNKVRGGKCELDYVILAFL